MTVRIAQVDEQCMPRSVASGPVLQSTTKPYISRDVAESDQRRSIGDAISNMMQSRARPECKDDVVGISLPLQEYKDDVIGIVDGNVL